MTRQLQAKLCGTFGKIESFDIIMTTLKTKDVRFRRYLPLKDRPLVSLTFPPFQPRVCNSIYMINHGYFLWYNIVIQSQVRLITSSEFTCCCAPIYTGASGRIRRLSIKRAIPPLLFFPFSPLHPTSLPSPLAIRQYMPQLHCQSISSVPSIVLRCLHQQNLNETIYQGGCAPLSHESTIPRKREKPGKSYPYLILINNNNSNLSRHQLLPT